MVNEHNWRLLKQFFDVTEANQVFDYLLKNDINAILEDDSPDVDLTFTSGNPMQNLVQIKVDQVDFEKAKSLLLHLAEQQVNNVPADYYLLQFSTKELFEVLEKADEWSEYDVVLAKKLLTEKGENLSNDQFKAIKVERLNELADVKKSKLTVIIIGYAFALLAGVIGMAIGWFMWKSKKSLPNGNQIFAYRESDRNHGKIIFAIGLISTIIYLLRKFLL